MLYSNHISGLTNWYARPTAHGTINNGIYIPVRPRHDNMNRSSAQPNVQSHINETTSMVKGFQQQASLSNTLMSMPVLSGEKNSFDPWVTAVEISDKLSHQDHIDIAMTS